MVALKWNRYEAPGSKRHTEARAEAAFRDGYPDYAATRIIDSLRASEYRRFDEQRHAYLDYTGGGVYAESQLRSANLALAWRFSAIPTRATPRRCP